MLKISNNRLRLAVILYS